jgi:hypothetical protein
MGTKVNIYIGPPMDEALACLGGDYNRSGRLNTVCERYLVMVRCELSRINFTHGEWCAILDANNGVELSTGVGEINATMLWANVADSIGLGAKWGINQDDLVRRMRGLSKSAAVTVLEICDRFWSRSDLAPDEALAKAGVTIAEKPHGRD